MSANLTTPPALLLKADTIVYLLLRQSIFNPIPAPSLEALAIIFLVSSIPSKLSSNKVVRLQEIIPFLASIPELV